MRATPAARAVAQYAALHRDREFIVIDTGGFEPDASAGIFKEMAKQTRQAVAEAFSLSRGPVRDALAQLEDRTS